MARGMKVMVDPAFPDHRKVRALGRALGIPPMQALGHVVALWCRVMKEAPLGNIRSWDDNDIADGAKWEGDAGKFVRAMRSKAINLLDRYQVHDWIEEQGDIVAQRETWRKEKAQQRIRERERMDAEAREKELSTRTSGTVSTKTDADVQPDKMSGKTSALSQPPVPFPSVPVPSVPIPTRETGGGPDALPPGGTLDVLGKALEAAAPKPPEDELGGHPERCDDVLRQLLQIADRTTQMPNKRATLIKFLQAARLRHGADVVQEWLMDPMNRGANVLVLDNALEERKRKTDRIF